MPVAHAAAGGPTSRPSRRSGSAPRPPPGNLILEYRNNAWKVQPTTAGDRCQRRRHHHRHQHPQLATGERRRRPHPGSFNVLNYFNTTGEAWVAAKAGRECTYFVQCDHTVPAPSSSQQLVHSAAGEAAGIQGPRGAADAANLRASRRRSSARSPTSTPTSSASRRSSSHSPSARPTATTR